MNSRLKSSDILSPTAHDLVETHTCDSSSKHCMLGNCPVCLKPGLSLPHFKADVDLISFLQWQLVEKKTAKVNQTMPFGQMIPKWLETISNLKRHIYTKREQVATCNKHKGGLKTEEALSHADYSESYNNTQEDEFRVLILVSKTSVFLLPVHITVKSNKAIWRRSLSQLLVNLVTILK